MFKQAGSAGEPGSSFLASALPASSYKGLLSAVICCSPSRLQQD